MGGGKLAHIGLNQIPRAAEESLNFNILLLKIRGNMTLAAEESSKFNIFLLKIRGNMTFKIWVIC